MKNTINLQNQLQTTLRKSLPLILFLSPTQIAGTTHSQKENLTHTLKTLQNQKTKKPTEKKKGYLHQTTSTARSTSKKTGVQTWADFTKSERPVTEDEALALIQKAVKEIRQDTQKQCKQFEIELEKENQRHTHELQNIEKDLEKLEQDDLRQNKQLAQNNQTLKQLRQNTREMRQEVEEIIQNTRETRQEVEEITQGMRETRQKVGDVRKELQKRAQESKSMTQQLKEMSDSIEQTLQESAQAREENTHITLLAAPEPRTETITHDNPNTLSPTTFQPHAQEEILPTPPTWWDWGKSSAIYTAGVLVSVAVGYYLGGKNSQKSYHTKASLP